MHQQPSSSALSSEDRAFARQLAVHRKDLQEAKMSCDLYLANVEGHNSSMREPLLTAAVVAYGRAFKFDRGVGDKYRSRLNKAFGAWPPLDPNWMRLHLGVLALRDEMFAHSDTSRRNPVVHMKGDRDPEHEAAYESSGVETTGWWVWFSN